MRFEIFVCKRAKKKKKLLRAPSSMEVQFVASRSGKKMLSSPRDKNEGTYRSGEGVSEEGPLCDPRSELLLVGRARVVRG